MSIWINFIFSSALAHNKYPSQAIDEAEDEWSQHNAKKLIDTSVKDLRASIPKDFPYFHVEFGLNKGFVHVIDDEKQFSSSFGLNVIRGMLKLPPEDMHQHRRRESVDTQREAVASFARDWEPFDWTKQLWSTNIKCMYLYTCLFWRFSVELAVISIHTGNLKPSSLSSGASANGLSSWSTARTSKVIHLDLVLKIGYVYWRLITHVWREANQCRKALMLEPTAWRFSIKKWKTWNTCPHDYNLYENDVIISSWSSIYETM